MSFSYIYMLALPLTCKFMSIVKRAPVFLVPPLAIFGDVTSRGGQDSQFVPNLNSPNKHVATFHHLESAGLVLLNTCPPGNRNVVLVMVISMVTSGDSHVGGLCGACCLFLLGFQPNL